MSVSQAALRALLVVASAALCVVTALSASALWPAIVVLAALTLLAALRPESPFALALVVLHPVQWLAIVPVPEGPAGWFRLLLASVLLLLVHLSAAAAVVWPEAARVPARALVRWAVRALGVTALTVPVWALALVVNDRSLAGDVGLTFAATAGVALLAGALYLATRETTDR